MSEHRVPRFAELDAMIAAEGWSRQRKASGAERAPHKSLKVARMKRTAAAMREKYSHVQGGNSADRARRMRAVRRGG